MVSILVGSGSGYARGSGNIVGGAGLLGSGTQGRGGDNVSVNAATGNLLISREDEFLVGRGLDVGVSRTYNSFAQMSDGDNGDQWQQSTMRRVFGLTGTLNTAGSTISRQGGDGSVIVYTWDAGREVYVTTDGNGAHDTLEKINSSTWQWTDGSSRILEVYEVSVADPAVFRIAQQWDSIGNRVNFTYVTATDKLDMVTTHNHGAANAATGVPEQSYVKYIWSGNNVTEVQTGYTDYRDSATPADNVNRTLTRTRYAYDASNRLITVTVDLSPDDNSVADGRTYVTTYDYDDNSKRVASISQTDGSRLDVTYDGSGRVLTLTQTVAGAETRVTTLSYQSGYTNITGSDGLVTRLDYDAAKQLKKITAPTAQTVQFGYDNAGNLTSVTDSASEATVYTYDAGGNVLTVTDPRGNVVTRTYGLKNELLSETRKGFGTGNAQADQTTRYVYNSLNLLRYVVSAEGHVTEYRYNGSGQLLYEIGYPEHAYSVAGLLTETGMNGWRDGIADRQSVQFTSYAYDSRGNLYEIYGYGSANAAGNGTTTEGVRHDRLTYDQAGRLLARSTETQGTERFAYDGMGRLVASVDLSGGVTTYRFDDAATTTLVHLSTGLTQAQVYNKAGDLVSETSSTPGYQPGDDSDLTSWATVRVTRTNAAPIGGDAAYTYTLDATGNAGLVTKNIAVAAGETVTWRITVKGDPADAHRIGLAGTADIWGTIAGTDASAVIVSGPGSVSNVGTYGSLFDLTGLSETQETVIELRRTFTQAQTASGTFYIGGTGTGIPAGMAVTLAAADLTKTVTSTAHAISATATYLYDENGRLRVATDAAGGKSYYMYDQAGRKIADVNHYGHITEYRYDAAGRLAASVSYTNPLAGDDLTALGDPDNILEIADIRPAANILDIWSWSIYDDAGRLVQSIAGDGSTSLFSYDASNRLIQTVRYYNKLTAQLAGFKTTSPTAPVTPTPDTRDTVVRSFYDNDGRLIGALDGEGYLTEIVYDKAGQKVDEIAYAGKTASGHRASGSFTELKGDTAIASAGDRHMRYVYDGQGLLRFTVDNIGQVTEYVYRSDISAGAVGPARATIRHAITISTSDFTLDNVKALVTPNASHTANRTNWSVYDIAGRLAYAIDADGAVTAFTYDIAGQLVRTIAFAAKRVTTSLPTEAAMNSWRDANIGNGANRIVRNWYDAAGNLRFTVDAEGYVARFDYDKEGRLIAERRPPNRVTASDTTTLAQIDSLTDSAGTAAVVTYSYDYAGRQSVVTDAEGSQTLYGYYANGMRYATLRAYNTVDQARTNYGFDATGRIISQHDAFSEAEPEPANSFRAFDGLGNLASVTDARGKVTTYTYDERGLVLTMTDAAGGVTAYEYNAFGEVVKVTDPKGGETYSYYDGLGRVTKVRDAENHVTETSYTRFGEVASVKRYYNPTASALSTTTPPTVAAHAQDATTLFEYDKRGLVTKTTDAEGWFESYGYDAFGDRTSVTAKSKDQAKVAGGITTYAYDKRGQLKLETLPVASYTASGAVQASTVSNSYDYDAYGNIIQAIKAVGLAEAHTTTYQYDKANRLKKTTGQAFQGLTPIETLTYDARGNVTSRTDAAGAKSVYFYDDLDRAVVTIDALGTYTAHSYDDNGNILGARVYGTRVTVPADGGSQEEAPGAPSGALRETSFTYDNLNRLLTSAVSGVTTGSWNGTNWVSNVSGSPSVPDDIVTGYQYDALGNVVKATDANGGATWNYYDRLGRKTHQVDAANYLTVWTYDGEGNVLTEKRYSVAVATPTSTVTPPALPTGDPALRETIFTYDRNGNRLSEARSGVLIHDGAGGIIHPSGETVTISWIYNGLGQVVQKNEATDDPAKVRGQVGDESIYYEYDAGGRLINEERAAFTDHLGTIVRPEVDYHYNGLGDLAHSLAAGATGSAARETRYAYDGGKLISVTDAAGFVRRYKYDVAGRVTHDYYTRLTSDGTAANAYEGTLTGYDSLGRAIEQWQATSSNGTSWTAASPILSTRYTAYGEVAKTGLNAAGVAEGSKLWQTQNDYDAAGRLWKTNAGDGVWKLFGYDKAGNQTIAIGSAGEPLAALSFTAALAKIGEDDVNATYTVYDKRNMAIATVEEGRQLGTGTTGTIVTNRSTNAFGEVASETAAHLAGETNLAVTTYSYNRMGRVTRVEGPAVQMTRENGTTLWIRASQDYYYDKAGRLVAVRDANGSYADNANNSQANPASKAADTGGLTRLTLLAGTGYGSADGRGALVTAEAHADGGVSQTKYDVHGDARVLIDEVNRTTTQSFDQMGRVTQVSHAGGLIDSYAYDGLGQRTQHWNNVLTSSNKETTDYDVQGRVIATRAFGGDVATTSYAWDATIAASGIGVTTGGWIQTVSTDADRVSLNDAIEASVQHTDLFDRVTTRTDKGGQIYSYGYDAAGRMVTETSSFYSLERRNRTYSYYNTGKISQIISGDAPAPNTDWSRKIAQYDYDALGQLKREYLTLEAGDFAAGHWVPDDPNNPEPPTPPTGHTWVPDEYYTYTEKLLDGRADYDALGRITRYRDVSQQIGPDNVDKAWTYDAADNVRSIVTTYRPMQASGVLATTTTTQSYWYRYDSMNRVVTTKGAFSGTAGSGSIVRGAVGTDLSYDAAGQRATARTGTGAEEVYTTNAAGLVTSVTIGGVLRAATTYNAYGQVTEYWEYDPSLQLTHRRYDIVYDGRGQVLAEKGRTRQGSDWIYTHTANYYSADGTGGRPSAITGAGTVGSATGGLLYFSETKNWKNGATTPVYSSTADYDYADAYTTQYYEWRDGAVQDWVTLDNRDGVSTSDYRYDDDGALALVRITGGARPRDIAYASGLGGEILARRERDLNDAASDPSSRTWMFGGRQMGMVGNDGTGNVDYATAIADRGEVPGTGAFRNGETSASVYADFDANFTALNGDTAGGGGSSYIVSQGDTLQGIAAAIWGDANLWYKLAEANGMTGGGALAAGQSLTIPGGVMNTHHTAETFKPYDPAEAIGNTSPSTPKPPKAKNCGLFGQIIATVVAAAASYLLGPIVGNVVSQGFNNLIGVQNGFSWKSMAISVVSAGVTAGVGEVLGTGAILGSQFAGDVIRGAASNALTQGVATATKLQNKFDFAGVAAAGVGAGIGQQLGSRLGGGFVNSLIANTAGGIANAATRSAINGNNFGDNFMAAIPDIIAQSVLSGIRDGFGSGTSKRAQADNGTVEAGKTVNVSKDDPKVKSVGTLTTGQQVERMLTAAGVEMTYFAGPPLLTAMLAEVPVVSVDRRPGSGAEARQWYDEERIKIETSYREYSQEAREEAHRKLLTAFEPYFDDIGYGGTVMTASAELLGLDGVGFKTDAPMGSALSFVKSQSNVAFDLNAYSFGGKNYTRSNYPGPVVTSAPSSAGQNRAWERQQDTAFWFQGGSVGLGETAYIKARSAGRTVVEAQARQQFFGAVQDVVTGFYVGPRAQSGSLSVGPMARGALIEHISAGTPKTFSQIAKGSNHPATRAAGIRGRILHSDKPGMLPEQLRSQYPNTEFEFARAGVAGQDVRIIGGQHPSAYGTSSWPGGVNYGDFKPGTPGGSKTFRHDQRNKWEEPTHYLPYDPVTGLLLPH